MGAIAIRRWSVSLGTLSLSRKCTLTGGMKGHKSDLVSEALELGEAAALQSFGAVAVEVVNTEFTVGGLFAEQVVGVFPISTSWTV